MFEIYKIKYLLLYVHKSKIATKTEKVTTIRNIVKGNSVQIRSVMWEVNISYTFVDKKKYKLYIQS